MSPKFYSLIIDYFAKFDLEPLILQSMPGSAHTVAHKLKKGGRELRHVIS